MLRSASLLGRADGPALRAFELLEELNADLLRHDSATLTLDRWCALHPLAIGASVVAELDRTVRKPSTAEQRRTLAVEADEPVSYRRVKLSFGGQVLSEADNWYVPGRLTAEMNRALDTTSVPFGRAVQALRFQRRTLSAELLWRPDLAGGESDTQRQSAEATAVPHGVLRHRAVLTRSDGMPFSEVVETYTSAVLRLRDTGAP